MSTGLLSTDSQEEKLLQCVLCSNAQLADAVLLKCLHSACRSCAENVSTHVTCPVCRVTTDTSTMEANLLVAALLHRSLIMKNVSSCMHSVSENQCGASSVVWCYTCQHSLCSECEIYHKRYNSGHQVIPIDEHTVLSELYRPPSRLCTEHGEELKHACFTCQDGRCLKCAHDCYIAAHDVQLLDNPAVQDRMKERKVYAERILSDLNSTDQLLQAHLSLPEKVASAVKESQASLSNAKKTALESIGKAYEKAEQSLAECWEILASKAELLRESAESLKTRICWTHTYCQVALRTDDVGALLPQLDTLHSRLCSLLDEAKQVKQPTDPLKLVNIKVCLPRDLDLITSDWIGEATLVSDNFECPPGDIPNEVNNDYYVRKVTTLSELEELLQQQKKQQENLQHQLLAVQQQGIHQKLKEQQLGQLKPLQFNEKQRFTFESPGGCCYDVAVTPGGQLLVAALSDGLKEYDAASFREIATWKPDVDQLGEEKSVVDRVSIALAWIVPAKRNEEASSLVCTVDALTDGRAVVGLHCKLIVLLRRDTENIGSSSNAQAWRVERCVTKLQASPRRLSAWGDQLLAVLEDCYDEHTNLWYCGSDLALLSLSDGGKVLNRQKLEYNALSVALTDRVVVVTSDSEVVLTDAASSGAGSMKCFVVDCYSHAGLRLWRHAVDGGLQVMSVCSDSVGRVIYAARTDSVVAVGVDDGRELCKAVTLRQTEKPYAIALDRTTQCLLALISEAGDEPNIITTFSVA